MKKVLSDTPSLTETVATYVFKEKIDLCLILFPTQYCAVVQRFFTNVIFSPIKTLFEKICNWIHLCIIMPKKVKYIMYKSLNRRLFWIKAVPKRLEKEYEMYPMIEKIWYIYHMINFLWTISQVVPTQKGFSLQHIGSSYFCQN